MHWFLGIIGCYALSLAVLSVGGNVCRLSPSLGYGVPYSVGHCDISKAGHGFLELVHRWTGCIKSLRGFYNFQVNCISYRFLQITVLVRVLLKLLTLALSTQCITLGRFLILQIMVPVPSACQLVGNFGTSVFGKLRSFHDWFTLCEYFPVTMVSPISFCSTRRVFKLFKLQALGFIPSLYV